MVLHHWEIAIIRSLTFPPRPVSTVFSGLTAHEGMWSRGLTVDKCRNLRCVLRYRRRWPALSSVVLPHHPYRLNRTLTGQEEDKPRRTHFWTTPTTQMAIMIGFPSPILESDWSKKSIPNFDGCWRYHLQRQFHRHKYGFLVSCHRWSCFCEAVAFQHSTFSNVQIKKNEWISFWKYINFCGNASDENTFYDLRRNTRVEQ